MNEEQKENVVVPEQNTNTDSKKEKKKKEKIPKKPKEEKEPKEPMDKKDLMCYIGALIFFILAFLPLLIRTFDASYSESNNPFKEKVDDEEEVEVRNTLTCNKTVTAVGYSYTESIINTYINSSIVGNVITYTITLNSDSTYTMDDVVIEEYNSLKTIESGGINIEVDDNVYVVRIDYNMDSGLKNNTLLDNHNKAISVQQINYESNGYTCTKE